MMVLSPEGTMRIDQVVIILEEDNQRRMVFMSLLCGPYWRRAFPHFHQIRTMSHLNECVSWMLSVNLDLLSLTQQWLGTKRLAKHLRECNSECILHSTRIRQIDSVLIKGLCIVLLHIKPIDHTSLKKSLLSLRSRKNSHREEIQIIWMGRC